MLDVAAQPGPGTVEARSLAASLASVLELSAEAVPASTETDPVSAVGPWLAERGIALVRVADPAGFRLPGYWIARLDPPDEGARYVVMFGVPSGVVWDPSAAGNGGRAGAGVPVTEALVLVPLEPPHAALPTAPAGTGTGTVRALFVAPAAEAPMVERTSLRAHAGRGLEGDRYADGGGTFSVAGGRGHEVTLVAEEDLAAAALPDGTAVTPAQARRNVVVSGIEIDGLIGREFRIGDVRLVGRRRCEPCAHLERLTAPGALRALVHRGGLRADLLSDGTISVGDTVEAIA